VSSREPDVVLFTDVCSPGFGRYAGTYRIASELRDQGYIVQIIEYFTRWSTDEIKSIISKFITKQCLWVGVSTTFLSPDVQRKRSDILRPVFTINQNWKKDYGTIPPSITGRDDWEEVVEYIRSINPKIVIAAGGAKADLIPESDKTFDVITTGQGETSALELSNALYEGSKVPRILTLPYNDYFNCNIKFDKDDIIFPGEHLPIEIARGCIFKCSFCNYPLNGKKLWEFNRKPHLVREDIEDVHEQFGSTGFMFCDDTYNDAPEKVKRFHTEFTKLDYDIQFSTYARMDLIVSRWETAKLLYESGLRSVFFGVESLNTESAKSIGKGMDSEKIKDGLYRLKDECPDMIICLGLIVGLPHDTDETMRESNQWLQRPDCPVDGVTYHPLHIAPQSPLLDNSKMSNNPNKYGYTVDDKGGWIRNDGYEKDDAIVLSEELNNLCFNVSVDGDEMDKFGRVGSFTFFNRLQNIGYTVDDFRQGRCTQSECIKKEQHLMAEYKRRLGDI